MYDYFNAPRYCIVFNNNLGMVCKLKVTAKICSKQHLQWSDVNILAFHVICCILIHAFAKKVINAFHNFLIVAQVNFQISKILNFRNSNHNLHSAYN